MTAAANVYDHAAKQRAALLRGDEAAANQLIAAYGQAWNDISAHLETLNNRIAEARANGIDVTPAWLHQQNRLEKLLTQTETRIAEFARTAAPQLVEAQRTAVAAGQAHAAELAQAALGDLGVAAAFDAVDDRVLAQLVGHLRPGSPLTQLLAQLGPDAAERMRHALLTGAARGLNPREMVREARNALGGNLARALTIARTETLRAYRESTRLAYANNPDSVLGWRWQSARDARTCAACWAMDGTEHPPTERLDGHANCRCAMLPLTPNWSELGAEGVPGGGVVDYGPTGPQEFARLPPDQQRRILGPAKHRMYAAGDLDLGDVVGRTESKAWGTMRRERSLADIRAEKLAGHNTVDARLGRRRILEADPSLGIAAELDGAIPRDAIKAARVDLDDLRARLRQEARAAQSEAGGRLEMFEGGHLRAPGPGGEWDWYRELTEDERKRLRRNGWVGREGAQGPEDLADKMFRVNAVEGDTVDAAIDTWLELTRRHDAAGALARGKPPSVKPYGGRTLPRGLARDLEADGYDPFTLVGSDRDAIRHVAETNFRITTGAEAVAEDWRAVPLRPARLGPSPWEMTEQEYVDEVDLLRDVTRNLEVDDFGEPVDAAFAGDLNRLEELEPHGAHPEGLPPDPHAAWAIIRELARRQYLT